MPQVVLDAEFEQVIGLHAGWCIGLNHHPLQASGVGEVVDIGRTQGGGDDVVDGVIAHAQRAGFVAVNVKLQLRCVFQAVGAHLGDDGAFGGQAQQLTARGQQGFAPQTHAVLQTEAKARG